MLDNKLRQLKKPKNLRKKSRKIKVERRKIKKMNKIEGELNR